MLHKTVYMYGKRHFLLVDEDFDLVKRHIKGKNPLISVSLPLCFSNSQQLWFLLVTLKFYFLETKEITYFHNLGI
jgi:hypothetical protein